MIKSKALIQLELKVAIDLLFEAFGGKRHTVDPGLEEAHGVLTGGIRNCTGRFAGRRFGSHHLDLGDGKTGGIGDAAPNVAGKRLSMQGLAHQWHSNEQKPFGFKHMMNDLFGESNRRILLSDYGCVNNA